MTRQMGSAVLYAPGVYPPFLLEEDAPTPACDGKDPELWFPERSTGGNTAVAKATCRRCPLCDRCRAWALGQPTYVLYGVWGGLSHNERAAIKRRSA